MQLFGTISPLEIWRDLLSLSDRELADIGISRTDVDRIVSQAARDARR